MMVILLSVTVCTSLLMDESRCTMIGLLLSMLAIDEHLAKATACCSFSRCRTMASQPNHSLIVFS